MRWFQKVLTLFFILVATAALSSCATVTPLEEAAKAPERPPEAVTKPEQTAPPPYQAREYVPASEEVSPLRTKKLSISARNSPLRDIIFTIAESTGLNVTMDKGVDPETPVTIVLKNMSAEDVLESTLSSANYFYTIRDNVIAIKLYDTRIFEFGTPSVIQEYSVEVGGDMLGAAKTGSAGMAGSLTQRVSSDKDSFKFWDSVEKSIAGMLGVQQGAQGGPDFSVNRMTGTIVVTASKKDLSRVEGYLNLLKKILKRQVMVEARIVEVQLSDSLRYGIDWSFLGDDVSLGASGFTNPLSNLQNFNITVAGADFSLLLKALQQQGSVNVLSNPRVSILNGQTAYLSVGRKVDYISKVETTTTGTGTATPSISFTVSTSSVLSGLAFGIVPYINGGDGDSISMSISPIISDLVDLDEKTVGTSGSNSVEISLPTVDLRELSTTVQVADGQIVVIGGLIQNRERVSDNDVPLLSEIPLIGVLFQSREKTSEKTELIIMLKPVLVPERI